MCTGRAYAVWFAAALCVLGGCGAVVGSDPNLEKATQKPPGGPSGGKPPKDVPSPFTPQADETTVTLCHVPPGSPDDAHTIVVSPKAVPAHLAHGDRLGPCEEQEDPCARLDTDGDGVNDCDDACADTPAGDAVDARGCSVLMLRADVGADVSVTEGATVEVQGSAEVVQGQPPADALVWTWAQTSGAAVSFQSNGPSFSFDTTGVIGSFSFRASVSDSGAAASASDDLAVEVLAPYVVRLAAGKWHNVAVYNNSRVRPWGWNRYGQLGDGSVASGTFDADAAARHSLLVAENGAVSTFGINALSSTGAAAQVPGASNVVQGAALAEGAMMLRSDGALMAFTGSGGSCLLGGASAVDSTGAVTAIEVPGAPANLVEVAAGAAHVVALDENGTAWVWGSRFGCTPRAVLTNVTAVAAGDTDLCLFIRNDGTAWAMGFNLHGQLGNGGTVSNYTVPTRVQGLSDVVDVAAGDRHSLFVTGDGSLWAAGWNRYCQLGLEAEPTPAVPQFGVNIVVPTRVNLPDVVTVAGGETHSIAVTADGTLWAWGLNNVGQLHAGSLTVLPSTTCMPMAVEFP